MDQRPRERRVDLRDVALKIDRIYVALFEEVAGVPGLFTRVRLNEQQIIAINAKLDDEESEKKANRIIAAIGTIVGSTVGSAVAVIAMFNGGNHK